MGRAAWQTARIQQIACNAKPCVRRSRGGCGLSPAECKEDQLAAILSAARGMARILIANRTAQKAQALAHDLLAGTSVQAEALSFDSDTLGRAMDCVDILVNATGIGMQPHEGQLPIAANCLLPRVLVCDLAYNPPATRLLLDAEQIGCRTMNGLKMAVYQGVRQFEILTGRRAPFEEMLHVMKQALP